jgi:cellulose synthase/poly-beta-1,6-N-acetylglucosamine synthase-like glycosyltransferase/peptidoglycan/xylan/chitin deacetylase (PgdA/CDA1 family)/spore germination protein YaaH
VNTELSSNIKPIFFDKKGRRRKLFNYLGLLFAATFTVFAGLFIASVLVNPFLPQLRLHPATVLPQKSDITPPVPERPVLTRKEASLRQASARARREKLRREEVRFENEARRQMLLAEKPITAQLPESGDKRLAIGFYVNWDYSSYTSLKHNITQLDWLVPEWIRISGDDDNPLVLDIDDKAMDLIHQQKPEMPVLPLLQNYKDEQWNSDILVRSISSEAKRQKMIGALLDVIAKNGFRGLTVDIEEVPPNALTDLFIFVSELHQELQKRGLILAQSVPFDNPDWNYRAFSSITDYLMLMGYDEHWSTGPAGPIAGEDWFESTLKRRMAELSPARTIVCIGNYGYNWSDDGSEAETDSFQQALVTAKESLDSPTDIKFDASSKNPYFTYDEEDGTSHTVWFLDAVTALNQIRNSETYNVAGIALWRLGSEDPSFWKIFGSDHDGASTADLIDIKYGYDVDFDGTGEILQVKAVPQDGTRDITATDSGEAASEVYRQIPTSYLIQRTGDKPGKIVLTFDDGPDPRWTPQILDILRAENVKAAFFIVGENGQQNPDLLKRIVNEGHEIGNHSFTHPNLGEIPDQVVDLELNTTQRLIESVTGRSTRLFRAPYFGDAEPRTPDEVGPTVIAQNLGYISVGLHLDPDDWKTTNDDGSRHTADEIVNDVVEAAKVNTPEERGNVILLHDSGGDRSATVEALPKLIHELRQRGYEFTTVSDLAGISPDEAMPFVHDDESFYARSDAYVFYALSVGGWMIRWLFLIGIILGIGRMLFIGALAVAQYLRSRRRERLHFGEGFEPLVSVVVPAYNEERVIRKTIESLLASDYEHLEVIVVDDGSTDGTMYTLKEHFAGRSDVQIYSKPNGGKAEALNFGWRKAKGEIIVALDADTVFAPGTVSALVHRFADERVGAVAGNAKVGNRVNVVTRWQALEYVTSQNFDRRAFSSLNCITVVPGAVGAWRRGLLEQTGGFSSGTLAEDQDLTIEVRKLHYRIGYEENAVAYTEAPDTLRDLARQRFRWSYGTLQCMWKHRRALLNPKFGTLGFIAMPNVWIFQVFFPLISPLMDLMFLWTLGAALVGYLEHQREYAHTPTNLNEVIFYYALFLAVDWIGAFVAFLMEKREQKKLLWWLFIQRFGYRQVMYWVMVRSVFTAVRGAIVGWGKLERKATVEVGA